MRKRLEVKLEKKIENFYFAKWFQKKHFEKKYWNGKNFLKSAPPLITINEINTIIKSPVAKEQDFKLFKNGILGPSAGANSQSESGFSIKPTLDPVRLSEFVNERGYSLKIVNIDRYHTRIREFCNEISLALGKEISINLYLTPGTEPCFTAHTDNYNILVLQIMGSKIWDLGQNTPTKENPGEFNMDSAENVKLEAGDLFYLPRAVPHRAKNVLNEVSVHLTIGLHDFSYAEIVKLIIEDPKLKLFWDSQVPENQSKIDPNFARETILQNVSKWFNAYRDEDIGKILATKARHGVPNLNASSEISRIPNLSEVSINDVLQKEATKTVPKAILTSKTKRQIRSLLT